MRKPSYTSVLFARLVVNKKRYSLLAVLLVSASIVTGAFVTVRHGTITKASAKAASVAPQIARNTGDIGEYVHKRHLSSRVGDALNAIGDRLELPGKERLILLGNLDRRATSGQSPVPVRIFIEYPHRIRIEEQLDNINRISGYDGKDAWRQGETLSRQEKDTIESLVFDSADHFFIGQMQGFATRLLGRGFRPEDADANYSGTLYNVFQVNDRIPDGDGFKELPKFYYFNSKTMLLEQIRYQTERDGQPLEVEVQLRWQRSGDQQIPVSITRIENGEPVLQFNVTGAQFAPRVADNSFNKQ